MKKRKSPKVKKLMLAMWSRVYPVLLDAIIKIAAAVIIHQLTVSPAIENLPRILLV